MTAMTTEQKEGACVKSRPVRTPREVLADKCRATKITDDGHLLICWKSLAHVTSKHPDRRRHYDHSADEYWTG